MNNYELEKARKTYLSTKKENNNLISKKERLEELKKTKEVIEYLNLLNIDYTKIKTERELIENSFKNIAQFSDNPNNIYVYFGSYYPIKNVNETPALLKQEKLKKYIDYFDIYVNLETEAILYVDKNNIEEFHKKNNIIEFYNVNDKDMYTQKFKLLQYRYFNMLTYTSQENAISKLKKLSPIYI